MDGVRMRQVDRTNQGLRALVSDEIEVTESSGGSGYLKLLMSKSSVTVQRSPECLIYQVIYKGLSRVFSCF